MGTPGIVGRVLGLLVACLWCVHAPDLPAQDADSWWSGIVADRDPSSQIEVTLSGDQQDYKPGDVISLTARVNRDCYLFVLHVSPTGKATLLWPGSKAGWEDRVAPDRPIRIIGPGTGINVTCDGSHPTERFIAFASTERCRSLDPGNFKASPDGRLMTFTGDITALVRAFDREVREPGEPLEWGFGRVALRVAASDMAQRDAEDQQRPRDSPPFAIVSYDGLYLSGKGGKFEFSARQIGPTEMFRLRTAGNAQFKIVAHDGSMLAAPADSSRSRDRLDVFDVYGEHYDPFNGVGFRTSNGRYLTSESRGGRLVFSKCAPSLKTREGLFVLVPVRDRGSTSAEVADRDSWSSTDQDDLSPASRFIRK
ncbi:MAG: DUF4384 domain-containing protein [Thermodesulfobacteriota bacterium]